MTIDELLEQLHSVESELRSPEVQLFMRAQAERTRKRFVMQLNKISAMINRLENDQLIVLAGRLNELDGELKAGVENIKERIKDLDDSIAVVNAVSAFVGVAARVVTLVA